MKKTRLLQMTELVVATINDYFGSTPRPASIPIDHPVWAAVERAVREKFGGEHIHIGSQKKSGAAKRNASILKDRQNGLPVSAIMTKYGLSRPAVYKILKLQKVNNPAA